MLITPTRKKAKGVWYKELDRAQSMQLRKWILDNSMPENAANLTRQGIANYINETYDLDFCVSL